MASSGESAVFLSRAQVVEAIERPLMAAGFHPLSRTVWRGDLCNGTNVRVGARLEGDWLLMKARLAFGSRLSGAIDPWSLLQANADLPGSVKFVVLPADPGLHARAELPVAAGVDLGQRLAQACAGFKQAAAVHARLIKKSGDEAAGSSRGRESVHRQVHAGRCESEHIDLPGLCEEAGWNSTERPDGTNVVVLDLPDDFAPAQVEVGSCGTLRVATEIPPSGGTPPPRCRRALGVLLLRAGGVLRLARAAAQLSPPGAEASPAVRFEVVFDSLPRATELAHALAALSVACRLYRREAMLLREDERLATAYLQTISKSPNADEELQPHQSSGPEAR
jgi:hypothetical protein